MTFNADFQIGRVDDQAGSTQRTAVFVAGGSLTNGPAARARLCARLCGAVAAQPLSSDGPMQMDYALAAWAGRPNDQLRAGVAEALDQPQYRRRRGSGPGQQIWAILQRPGEAVPLSGLRCRPNRSRGDHLGRQARIHPGDEVHDVNERVAAVVGRALRTPWPSVAISAADSTQLSARHA
jgi:hypothetical protein